MEAQQALQQLNLADVEALQAEVTRLRDLYNTEERRYTELTRQIGGLEQQVKSAQQEVAGKQASLIAHQQSVAEKRASHSPDLIAEVEEAVTQRADRDPATAAQNAENSAKGFTTQSNSLQQELRAALTSYNQSYSFRPLPPP